VGIPKPTEKANRQTPAADVSRLKSTDKKVARSRLFVNCNSRLLKPFDEKIILLLAVK
jgi:hypothetical protein